jgi:hypothetical protein
MEAPDELFSPQPTAYAKSIKSSKKFRPTNPPAAVLCVAATN